MKSARKTKVFWTEPEHELVAAWVVEIRSPDRSPELSILDAVRLAQETTLPANRQKQLRQMKNLPSKLLHLIQSGLRAPISTLLSSPPAPSAPLLETPLNGSPKHEGALAKPGLSGSSPWEGVVRGFLVDVLVDCAKRLLADPTVKELAADFWAGVARREVESSFISPALRSRHDPTGVFPVKKTRLRKVLIVGLKPAQRPVFESAYRDKLLLKFWCDENPDLLRSKAASSDHVLCTMDATSHASFTMAQKALGPNKKVVRIVGAASSIHAGLAEIINLGTVPLYS